MPQHWHASNRIGSSRGQKLRARRLQIHPLCAECQKLGIIRPTDEIDHIIPLKMGGTDTDDNVQGLCFAHHAAKTALEDVSHAAASNHPDWLRPSTIPITIVVGPPASGKTTYVREHAALGDTVIDLDQIIASIDPRHQRWTPEVSKDVLNNAIRQRNAMLGSLSSASHGQAWLIVAAPSQDERDWWARKLKGTVVLVHPGAAECKRRALERGTPHSVAGIDRWERLTRQPFMRAKPTIGLDGWPTD